MEEYVGFDVSKEETAFCVKAEDGRVLAHGKVSTEPDALFEALRAHCLCPARVVMETGTLSGWLARELGKFNVNVNVVAPGMVMTDMARNIPPEFLNKAIDETVIGRIASPEDVANAKGSHTGEYLKKTLTPKFTLMQCPRAVPGLLASQATFSIITYL